MTKYCLVINTELETIWLIKKKKKKNENVL